MFRIEKSMEVIQLYNKLIFQKKSLNKRIFKIIIVSRVIYCALFNLLQRFTTKPHIQPIKPPPSVFITTQCSKHSSINKSTQSAIVLSGTNNFLLNHQVLTFLSHLSTYLFSNRHVALFISSVYVTNALKTCLYHSLY